MKRREFMKMLAAACAVTAAYGLRAAERMLPERVTEAWRGNRYPGRVKPLEHDQIIKPGGWAG